MLGRANLSRHTLRRGEAAVAEGDTCATVRELYDAYARRDFDCVAALIHDDIDWVIYQPVGVFPFAGARSGRAAGAVGDGTSRGHHGGSTLSR